MNFSRTETAADQLAAYRQSVRDCLIARGASPELEPDEMNAVESAWLEAERCDHCAIRIRAIRTLAATLATSP